MGGYRAIVGLVEHLLCVSLLSEEVVGLVLCEKFAFFAVQDFALDVRVVGKRDVRLTEGRFGVGGGFDPRVLAAGF